MFPTELLPKIELKSLKEQIKYPEKVPGIWLAQLGDQVVCRKAVDISPNILGLPDFDKIDQMGARCLGNMLRIWSGINEVQRKEWLPIQIGRFLEHILNETDPNKKLSIYACHDITREFIYYKF